MASHRAMQLLAALLLAVSAAAAAAGGAVEAMPTPPEHGCVPYVAGEPPGRARVVNSTATVEIVVPINFVCDNAFAFVPEARSLVVNTGSVLQPSGLFRTIQAGRFGDHSLFVTQAVLLARGAGIVTASVLYPTSNHTNATEEVVVPVSVALPKSLVPLCDREPCAGTETWVNAPLEVKNDNGARCDTSVCCCVTGVSFRDYQSGTNLEARVTLGGQGCPDDRSFTMLGPTTGAAYSWYPGGASHTMQYDFRAYFRGMYSYVFELTNSTGGWRATAYPRSGICVAGGGGGTGGGTGGGGGVPPRLLGGGGEPDGMSAGAIVGIIFVSLAVLGTIGGAWWYRMRRDSGGADAVTSDTPYEPMLQ